MCYAFLGHDEVEKIEMLHKRWERGIPRLRDARTCLSFLPVRPTSDGLGESII